MTSHTDRRLRVLSRVRNTKRLLATACVSDSEGLAISPRCDWRLVFGLAEKRECSKLHSHLGGRPVPDRESTPPFPCLQSFSGLSLNCSEINRFAGPDQQPSEKMEVRAPAPRRMSAVFLTHHSSPRDVRP